MNILLIYPKFPDTFWSYTYALSFIGYGEKNPAMYEAAPKELYSAAAKANMRVLFEIIVE
jgi:hypothetical protein